MSRSRKSEDLGDVTEVRVLGIEEVQLSFLNLKVLVISLSCFCAVFLESSNFSTKSLNNGMFSWTVFGLLVKLIILFLC